MRRFWLALFFFVGGMFVTFGFALTPGPGNAGDAVLFIGAGLTTMLTVLLVALLRRGARTVKKEADRPEDARREQP